MNRVLVLVFVGTIVALALWDIVRRNPQLKDWLRPRAPKPRRGGPPARSVRAAPPEKRGQVIELRRDPYQVLGIDRDASPADVEAHIERLRSENDPEKLEGLSADLRAHAERRLAEVEAAYAEIKGQS
ncbi:MAG TPA: hypothetical protein DFR83_23425 [Deltaproteobacteria bacterium]|nr:hypothetical protein [Deltaproteobacteria bacterium]